MRLKEEQFRCTEFFECLIENIVFKTGNEKNLLKTCFADLQIWYFLAKWKCKLHFICLKNLIFSNYYILKSRKNIFEIWRKGKLLLQKEIIHKSQWLEKCSRPLVQVFEYVVDIWEARLKNRYKDGKIEPQVLVEVLCSK